MAAFGVDENDNVWVAASNGDMGKVVNFIENQGVDVNAQDEHGYSPIHAAASYGQQALLGYLISKGADVNLRDADGDTPLLVCDDPGCFEDLLNSGADMQAKNTEDNGIEDRTLEFYEEENEAMIAYLKTKGIIPENFELAMQAMAESGIGAEGIPDNEDGGEGDGAQMQG
jgi:ankyrin repeat protein